LGFLCGENPPDGLSALDAELGKAAKERFQTPRSAIESIATIKSLADIRHDKLASLLASLPFYTMWCSRPCVSKADLITRYRSLMPMLDLSQNRFQIAGDRFLALARVLNLNDIQNHPVR
jgi:hypothetical protein